MFDFPFTSGATGTRCRSGLLFFACRKRTGCTSTPLRHAHGKDTHGTPSRPGDNHRHATFREALVNLTLAAFVCLLVGTAFRDTGGMVLRNGRAVQLLAVTACIVVGLVAGRVHAETYNKGFALEMAYMSAAAYVGSPSALRVAAAVPGAVLHWREPSRAHSAT